MNNLYGLIGERLGHSLSPQIHQIILKALNLTGDYQLFETKEAGLPLLLNELKEKQAKGVNITIPYKTIVMPLMDYISPEALKIGAINTIAFENGALKGYNTDYHGFGASLKKAGINIADKKAVVLGTGGASKAVVHYLMDNGIKALTYVSRRPEKLEGNELNAISYDDLAKLTGDIIINCTPCGMYPKADDSPIDQKLFNHYAVAVDLIYNPEKTLFLRDAEKIGLKTMNGLYMLVAQAAAAQEIWQKIKIDEKKIDVVYSEIKRIFCV